MKTKRTVRLDAGKVGARLSLCAAAIAGAAGTAPVANAAVISFTTAIPLPATTGGVYINLLTGATGGSGGAVAGWDFNPYLTTGGTRLGFYWNPTPALSSGGVAVASQYADLAPGTVVGSGSTFLQAILATNNYVVGGTHILGFRFFNEGAAAINYGFATITTTTGTGYPATLQGWSFENSGGSITVTSDGVPEPSSLALTAAGMALGALGMRRWRRKDSSK